MLFFFQVRHWHKYFLCISINQHELQFTANYIITQMVLPWLQYQKIFKIEALNNHIFQNIARALLKVCYEEDDFFFFFTFSFSRSKYVPASRCPHGWYEIEHYCFLFSEFKVLWTHARVGNKKAFVYFWFKYCKTFKKGISTVWLLFQNKCFFVN